MPAKRQVARAARVAPARAAPQDAAAAPRYRVLSGGISTWGGAIYRGAVVAADELGDAERVQKLLESRSIEVADD